MQTIEAEIDEKGTIVLKEKIELGRVQKSVYITFFPESEQDENGMEVDLLTELLLLNSVKRTG